MRPRVAMRRPVSVSLSTPPIALKDIVSAHVTNQRGLCFEDRKLLGR